MNFLIDAAVDKFSKRWFPPGSFMAATTRFARRKTEKEMELRSTVLPMRQKS